ncbi:MAG TPA: hypothetical protein VHC67_16665 [Gaiellaceae bacterium]|jgi:hypothetical protein|nr:hypothetical protein [Gaiellaceae bacterium]
MTTVWISPSATSYSCLCETCLEEGRTGGMLFADALMLASVRGEIGADVEAASRRCRAGHEIVLRRGGRPPSSSSHHEGQLQLA